jgi:hypothetical protein
MDKSTRHAKIIGNLGEMLICNWLSRSGFEVCVIDHTGIDLVAYHKAKKTRMGITVKARTRVRGKEDESVNLFRNGKKNDREKVVAACVAFSCEPWIGIYIEHSKAADVFLLSLAHYEQKYKTVGKVIDDWKMSPRHLKMYQEDAAVSHIHLEFNTERWQWGPAPEEKQIPK